MHGLTADPLKEDQLLSPLTSKRNNIPLTLKGWGLGRSRSQARGCVRASFFVEGEDKTRGRQRSVRDGDGYALSNRCWPRLCWSPWLSTDVRQEPTFRRSRRDRHSLSNRRWPWLCRSPWPPPSAGTSLVEHLATASAKGDEGSAS